MEGKRSPTPDSEIKPHKKTARRADSGTDPQSQPDYATRILETGRSIQEDAQALANTVNSATREVSSYLSQQLAERPYAALGVAAGVGFVLGGGLSARIASSLLTQGGRMLAASMIQHVLAPSVE